MKISICIPTYNRARYLEYLLPDLFDQISKASVSFEVNISDNCSDDHTSEIVSTWKDRLNINYLRHERPIDPAANLASALNLSTGEFALYLADDDFLDIEALVEAAHLLNEHPEVGILFAPWKSIELRDKSTAQESNRPITENLFLERQNFRLALLTILKHYFFTEIFLLRTSLLKYRVASSSPISFFHYLDCSNWLAITNVVFYSKSFYFQSISYFEDELHQNAGHDMALSNWDCYRGGLEHLLARIDDIEQEDLYGFLLLIDQFVLERLILALRLSIGRKSLTDYENYLLAMRIVALGDKEVLTKVGTGISLQSLKMKAVLFLLTKNLQWMSNKNKIIVLGTVDPAVQDFLTNNSDVEVVSAKPGLSTENSLVLNFSGETGLRDFLLLDSTSDVLNPDDILKIL